MDYQSTTSHKSDEEKYWRRAADEEEEWKRLELHLPWFMRGEFGRFFGVFVLMIILVPFEVLFSYLMRWYEGSGWSIFRHRQKKSVDHPPKDD